MNRYGRHGSGAWLRRHRRLRQKQVSTSLVIAKPFIPNVVINITVPAGVERVIVIMVRDSEDFDETNMPENVRHLNPPTVDASPDSQGIQIMHVGGARAAQRLLQKIREEYGSSSVYIDDDDIRNYAASRAIDIFDSPSFPFDQDYIFDDLKPIFVQSFQHTFEEHEGKHCNIQTEENWHISEIVRIDKETHLKNIYPIYQRDFGIIHAVEKSGITVQDVRTNIDRLQWIHTWADKYADFYSGKQEEVQRVHNLDRFRGRQ
jgi:hypothetical protein